MLINTGPILITILAGIFLKEGFRAGSSPAPPLPSQVAS